MACASPRVYLFELDESGSKVLPAIGDSQIESDGTYSVVPTSKPLNWEEGKIKYLVEVQGCAELLSRPITEPSGQDVSFSSSILSYVIGTSYGAKLLGANNVSLKSLINEVSEAADMASAYSLLMSDPQRKQLFQDIFGVAPTFLQEAPPKILFSEVPDQMLEGQSYSLSATFSHWSPTYVRSILWKENSVTLGSNSTTTWTPGGNAQGLKTISLFWGRDDGSGNLDLAKPFKSMDFIVTVSNNIQPTPPVLTLLSSSMTSNPSVSLSMTTGVSLSNCGSFSTLALTSSSIISPISTEFTINCTSDSVQVLPPFTLTGSDGQKTIALWAKDSSGNISLNPSVINLTLDQHPPSILSTVINGGAVYAGTALTLVRVDLTDTVSAATQVKVRLRSANVGTSDCQSEYANDNWIDYISPTTDIPFQISQTDGEKKVCVWAKDALGNVSMISPSQGTLGVNSDTIIYEVGSPPGVSSFSVVRNLGGTVASAGDAMTINWSVTDAEALNNNPVSFAYTTDNLLWKDISTHLDISNSSNISWIGSLTGNPTSGSGAVTSFTAPTSSYFRLKITVRDASNNTSIPLTSSLFNTGAWSVFAGSKDRGVGGGALSAAFMSGDPGRSVDINPITGDIYAIDSLYGVKKVDAQTGIVTTFIEYGSSNLPVNGAFPSTLRAPVDGSSSLKFDSGGRLYLGLGSSVNSTIYQIDLTRQWVRHYAGGGTDNDGGGSSTSLFATIGFGFDESSSMYLVVQCAPHAGTFNQGKRLLKILQNPDGSPGAVTRILGDCTYAAPAYGSSAFTSPFGTVLYGSMSEVIVWDNGNKIYFESYGNQRWKIINGIIYSVTFASNSCRASAMTYNPTDENLYRSNSNCGIDRVTPSLAGNGGEVNSTVIAGNSLSLGCTQDGILAANACTVIDRNMFSFGGLVYFSDGSKSNSVNLYRVRYLSSDGTVRTIAGSTPFYGNNLDRSLVRGSFAGVYYKQASEPNQTAFPAGLYFMDSGAAVLGHMDASTDITSILWGNQSRKAGGYSVGQTISAGISMGASYWGGAAMPLTFDSNGLPWLRADNHLYTINSSKQIVAKTTGATYWHNLANGANPQNAYMYVNSHTNLTLKNQGLFMLGAGYVSLVSSIDPNISIKLLDFSGLTTTKLLGGNFVYSNYQGASLDVGAGLVSAAPLDYSCEKDKCFTHYDSGADRLYFSEKDKIRYITTPSNTATATLNTLVASPGAVAVYNFTLRPDGTQIWYLANNNRVYCFDLSSGKSWCDNLTNHFTSIGNTGMTFNRGANQLTWKDNNTLLLSTYRGEILEFVLPTGP